MIARELAVIFGLETKKEDFDKVMARLAELEAKNAALEAAAIPKAPTKSKDLRI